MRRLFWLAMGATIGVLVVRKLTGAARALTPAGAARAARGTAGTVAEAIRDFADDVREGMAQREQELREGTGLDGRIGAKPEDF